MVWNQSPEPDVIRPAAEPKVCLGCLRAFTPDRHRHLCNPCNKSVREFQAKPRSLLVTIIASVETTLRRLRIAHDSPAWLYLNVDVEVDSETH